MKFDKEFFFWWLFWLLMTSGVIGIPGIIILLIRNEWFVQGIGLLVFELITSFFITVWTKNSFFRKKW